MITSNGIVLLSLQGVIDFAAEKERLNKELALVEKNLQGYAAKLNNQAFVAKAPEKVVLEEKRRQEEALLKKEKLLQSLELIAKLA